MDDDFFTILFAICMVVLVAILFFFMGQDAGFNGAAIQICNKAGYDNITTINGERYCYSVDGEELISPLELVRQ